MSERATGFPGTCSSEDAVMSLGSHPPLGVATSNLNGHSLFPRRLASGYRSVSARHTALSRGRHSTAASLHSPWITGPVSSTLSESRVVSVNAQPAFTAAGGLKPKLGMLLTCDATVS